MACRVMVCNELACSDMTHGQKKSDPDVLMETCTSKAAIRGERGYARAGNASLCQITDTNMRAGLKDFKLSSLASCSAQLALAPGPSRLA